MLVIPKAKPEVKVKDHGIPIIGFPLESVDILPERFRRQPISQEEIEYIEVRNH